MKRYLFIVLIIMIPFLNMVTFGYAVWDKTTTTLSPVIAIGTWTKLVAIEDLDNELINAFYEAFGVETLQALYDDPAFQEIMSTASLIGNTAGGNNSTSYTINNVNIEGITWEVFGEYVATNRSSIGFLRLVDRTVDPLLPVMPDPAISDTENYFVVYDLRNNLTNNDYSFRLDNKITITTEEPIQNLESFSFYAHRGLSVTGETLERRNITFSLLNGDTQAVVRTVTELVPDAPLNETDAPTSVDFTLYIFTLSQSEIDNAPASGYYIRISYDGGAQGRGGNVTRSRVVIDDLKINLLED